MLSIYDINTAEQQNEEKSMKVNFDIECTPEEARKFLGLPDVAPMQEKLMQELQERLEENIRAVSVEELIRTWMPATMQGMGQNMGQGMNQGFTDMQKMFWQQMGMAASGAATKNSADDEDKDKKDK
tara:strand:- start:21565 stop:21945 length:381 start_codon:yes stop_codon:yes gene_type:complete